MAETTFEQQQQTEEALSPTTQNLLQDLQTTNDELASGVTAPEETASLNTTTSAPKSLTQLANEAQQSLTGKNGPGDPTPSAKVASLKDLASVSSNYLKATDHFYDKDWLYKPYTLPQSALRKYDRDAQGVYDFTPFTDNEDRYAARDQGILSNTWKGIERFGMGTVAKLGEGVGFLGALGYEAVSNAVNGKWDGSDIVYKAAENGFSKVFSGLEDKMKNDWLPTYQEAADRDKGFWYRAFHDGDFWTDDVVDGMAFMASAWIPGIALSKLGLGVKVAQSLSRLGIGAGAAEATIEGAGEAANYLAKANTLFKTGIDKFTAWGLATGSEAMFEAAGIKDNIYNSLTYDQYGGIKINPETGEPYTEKEKREIAGGGAKNGFLLNAALLGGTNAVELAWFGKALGIAEKGTAKGIVGAKTLAEEMTASAAPTNFFGKLINSKAGAFVKAGAVGIGAEGFVEENGQLAIQRINEYYGAKGKISNIWNLKELANQYVGQTYNAVTGNDAEASANIGIGGLLGVVGGGMSGVRQYKADQAKTTMAINAYNNAQQSWLKFGDIYKTEEFTYKDDAGKDINSKRAVLDKNNKPIIDDEKLMGVVGAYNSVGSALDEANRTKVKFQRDLLRDTAFADYVTAHINAGIESTISGKLDSIAKASPGDVAKLGFSLDDDFQDQINRYKSLSNAIISQNKLINSDVLVKDEMGKKPSEDAILDTSRKSYLTTLAAQQAVHKNLLAENMAQSDKVKAQLLDSTNTSLSDGIIDQLNEMQHRINSQKELIDAFKKTGTRPQTLVVAEKVLAELEEDKADLEKENQLSIKGLKQDGKGFYQYEKNQRNEPGVKEQYDKRIKLQGELKNHIRSVGIEWARYADTRNGRDNFRKYVTEEIVGSAMAEQEQAMANQPTANPQANTTTATNTAAPGTATNPIRIRTVKFKDADNKDQSFTFKEGSKYKQENKDGEPNYFTILKISDDGKTISLKVDDEGAVDMPAEEVAKMAKANRWFESVGTKAIATTPKTQHPAELNSDIHIESDPKAATYSLDDRAPKFEEVGFNKTFGVHYTDMGDTTLNKESGAHRFFFLTGNNDLTGGDYKLMVITKSNDDKFGGIREANYNADDIKVVVVKKVVDTNGDVSYAYVDMNNNIIPEGQATKDNIVYRSLSNIKSATPDNVRINPKTGKPTYTVDKSTTNSEIQAQIDMHAKYQQDLVERTAQGPVILDIVGNSPGIQRIEKTTTVNAKGEREYAKAPVEGRIVVADPDWSSLRSATNENNFVTLRVETTGGSIIPGLLPGRAVIQEFTVNKQTGEKTYTNKAVRVFNREFNEAEKDTLSKALARFSELFGRKPGAPELTDEEKAEYNLIQEYLRGMLNWGSPKDSKAADKYVWIQNGLHINNVTYSFDRATMLANKDAMFKGAYHHINNKFVQKNDSFETIRFAGDKAVPAKSYDTYQEYLLAARENGEVPPVYTSLPKVDSEKPQRTNVFLTWRDPAAGEMIPIGKKEKKYTAPRTKTAQANAVIGSKYDQMIDDFVSYKTKKIQILNTTIEYKPDGSKVYIEFTNKNGAVRKSNSYGSIDELLAIKEQVKKYIYQATGYKPGSGALIEIVEAAKQKKSQPNINSMDKNIDDFVNVRKNKIELMGWKIEHVYAPRQIGVKMTNLKTKEFFTSKMYSSKEELIKIKDVVRDQILDKTGYKPIVQNTTAPTATAAAPTGMNMLVAKMEEAKAKAAGQKAANNQQPDNTNPANNTNPPAPVGPSAAQILVDKVNELKAAAAAKLQGPKITDDPTGEVKVGDKFITTEPGNTTDGLTITKIEDTYNDGDLHIYYTDTTGAEDLMRLQYFKDNLLGKTLRKEGAAPVVASNKYKATAEQQARVNENLGTTPRGATLREVVKTDQSNGKTVSEYIATVPGIDVAEINGFKFFAYRDFTGTFTIIEQSTGKSAVNDAGKVQKNLKQILIDALAKSPNDGWMNIIRSNNSILKQRNEAKTSTPVVAAPKAPVVVQQYTDLDMAVVNAVVDGDQMVATLYAKNTITNEFMVEAVASVKIPNGNKEAAKILLKQELVKQLNNEDEEAPFRLPIAEITRNENFQKLNAFMQAKLPQFPITILSHLIQGKAWGMFSKGGIYIYKNAGEGTGFHEAFEAVWAAYVTDEQKQNLANEFRNRPGTFYNPFSKETKAYRDASMYDVREMLAEEFSKHIIDDQQDDKSWGNTIKAFFRDLWNHIKSIFGMNTKDKAEMEGHINKLFKSIKAGEFKNLAPIRELNRVADTYKAVGTLTQAETAGILTGINYNFFKDLYSKGYNINSILNNLEKEESNKLLKDLYTTSFSQVTTSLERLPALKQQVEAYQGDLYDMFKKNLERYGLVFNEIDVEEDAINNPLGISDTIGIDPRKMTTNDIQLLLSTIPETAYSKEGDKNPKKFLNEVLVKNEYFQPKLINAGKVHITLLNELSNIAAIVDEKGERKNVLDQMFAKLDNKYKMPNGRYRDGYLWINGLKRRLKYEENGIKIDGASLTKDEIQLRVSFIKSFNNIKNIPEKVIVDSDGYIYNFNPLVNVNLDRVKEEWSNNLKMQIQDKTNSIVRVDAAGTMIIDRSTQDYSDLVAVLNNVSDINLVVAQAILSRLGVEFSGSIEELAKNENTIKESAIVILNLINNGEINTINELYGNQLIGGRMNALLDIEAKFTSEDNILSYSTAEGEPQYAVGIPSLFSQMINTLNSVANHTELIRSCPWLGYIDEETGQPVLNTYQMGSELLKKGGILFDGKGDRRSNAPLSYHVISGMGTSDSDGTNTADLQFPERVANKIHFLLNNIVFSNINSDKSTEFGIGIPGKPMVSYQDVRNFMYTPTTEEDDDEGLAMMQSDNYKRIGGRYITHLTDEMGSAVLQNQDPTYIQYYANNKVGVNRLGHFRDIIGEEMIDKFNKEVLSDEAIYTGENPHIEFIKANEPEIAGKIRTHIVDQIVKTVDFLKDLDIFENYKPAASAGYVTNALDNNDSANSLATLLKIPESQTLQYKSDDEADAVTRVAFSEYDITMLAGMLVLNEELLLTEQHKFIYGHPAMYKELAKRANGATSTKEAFVEDSDVIRWQDKNMPRLDGKERSKDVHQTTRVVSFKDQDVVSLFHKDIIEGIFQGMIEQGMNRSLAQEKSGAIFNEGDNTLKEYILKNGEHTGAIKAYLELNEADAMAWGMPDAIRDMLFSTSKLTAQQEKQWNYEVAYEKLVRSGRIRKQDGTIIKQKDPAYKSYLDDELDAAQAIYDEKDPGYIFQVLKPQYFGYANTKSLMHPVFLKHAVQPKFYRHVEGSQYEKLYLAAQKNEVDIIGFVSGQKVGAVTDNKGRFTPIYNELGASNIIKTKKGYDFPESLVKLDLYSKFYGIQVEMSNKAKNSVVRGTQVTKLVMVNFFENGEAITPDVKDLIEDYNRTLKAMISLGKESLIKDLGLEREGIFGYKTKDLAKLVSLLREEAEKRDLPDNMIDAINALKNPDGTQELQYSFDTLINREKIDNILNSIVDSRVISAKMHGKASTQVSSTLYETNPRGFMYLKDGVYTGMKKSDKLTDEQKASVKMHSSDLSIYRNIKGKITSMEVYITWPYDEVTPEELGLKLDNGIYKMPKEGLSRFAKELLDGIGFRIPTDAMNKIESYKIKGFTPKANGDMIVVPSEIVGKAGSDFDIDKLNLYLANYYTELIGKDYSDADFKAFMIQDMLRRGADVAFANGIMEALSVEELKKINESTYTESGRLKRGAKTSLSDIAKDNATQEDYAYVKQSISNFNAQYKGPKAIRYIAPEFGETKQQLENKFITIMGKLINHPKNYAQLVSPSSVDTLKGLATEIKAAKIAAGTKTEENEKSPTFLRTFVGSSLIRERYLTAKRMVGIAAIHTTFHSLAQVSGLALNDTFKTDGIKYLMPKDKSGRYQEYKAMNIKIAHHAQQEDGTYAIGYRTDVVGQMISELFSEAVSGFVDGAKDPFVFDLNFSLNTAGTWFYLQHLGASEEEIAYFLNQPILDEYFTEVAKNKSNFKVVNNQDLSKEELFFKIIKPYFAKAVPNGGQMIDMLDRIQFPMQLKNRILGSLNGINGEFAKFELADLRKSISEGKSADPKLQLAVLMNFLEYEAQGRLLGNFMGAISYDNKKTRTTQDNMQQVARWKRSEQEGFIANPVVILDNTFIGEMKDQKEDVFNLFKNFFITLTPDIQQLFKPIYDKIDNPDYFSSKDDMTNLLNRYQNFVLTYILQTTEFTNAEGKAEKLNHLYKDLFTGSNSMAKVLDKYKNSEDPNISNNLIIKELLPMMTDDVSKTDNIALFRNRIDTYEINTMIEALDNLKSYATSIADTNLLKFIDNLSKFSILQSGLQSSKIDYKKILSINTYSELVKDILNRFIANPVIDAQDVWENFHQNNWTNRKIVPKAPTWLRAKGGVIKIKTTSSYAINDFLVKYALKKTINGVPLTKDLIKTMKKEKTFLEQAFEPVLYKNTFVTDVDKKGNRMWVYEPVTKKGNGNRMTEINSDDTSILPKNNVPSPNTNFNSSMASKGGGFVSISEIMGMPAQNEVDTSLIDNEKPYSYLNGKSDDEIRNSKEYKDYLKDNPVPNFMTDQEHLEYFKECKI